jgi:hypothetical protein
MEYREYAVCGEHTQALSDSEELIDTGMHSSPAPTEPTVVDRFEMLATDDEATSR